MVVKGDATKFACEVSLPFRGSIHYSACEICCVISSVEEFYLVKRRQLCKMYKLGLRFGFRLDFKFLTVSLLKRDGKTPAGRMFFGSGYRNFTSFIFDFFLKCPHT